jgi:hypothetical protein
MLYTHNKHWYAIGLAWSDFVDSAQARAHVRKARKPSIVVDVTGQGTGQQAVAVGLSDDAPLPGSVVSAAMAVGLVFPNTLICQTLADGRVWFASVASGVPFSGHDRIVSQEEVAPLLREQMSYVHDIVGDARDAKMSLTDALSLYESQVADGRITRSQVHAARLRPPASHAKRVAAASVVALALASAGLVLWLDDTDLRRAADREEALARLTQGREQAARQAAEKQARVAAFRHAVDQRRAQLRASQQAPRAQWEIWERVRRQLPLTVNGYVADAMECAPARCVIRWQAGSALVRYVDKAAIPDWIEDVEPATTARSEVALAPAPVQVAAPQGPNAAALRLAIAQALQFQAPDAGVGTPAAIVMTPPPGLGLQPVDLGTGGSVRIALGGPAALVRAHDVMATLGALPVSLESVRWTHMASSPSMELDGRWTFVNR